ncbi:MAG: RecQ family zinc-binding domain-containing protein [Pseudonocardiaceae bacterium]
MLGYFGEQLPHPCGNCDTCAAGRCPCGRSMTGASLPWTRPLNE